MFVYVEECLHSLIILKIAMTVKYKSTYHHTISGQILKGNHSRGQEGVSES